MAFYIGNNIVIDDAHNANVGVITATQTKLINSSEKIITTDDNILSLVYNTTNGSNVGYALSPTGPVTLDVVGIPTSTDFDDFSLSFKVIVSSSGIARTCGEVVFNGTNLPIYWDGGSFEEAIRGIDISEGHAIYKFDAINVTGSASTVTNFNIFGSLLDFYPTEGLQKTYSIMPDNTSVNEGGTITFTIMTSNVPSATPLYWALETSDADVGGADFTDGEVGGTIMLMNGMATLTRTLSADSITEGLEAFAITLRTQSTSGPVVAVSPMITVGDTSLATLPDYMLMPTTTLIREGGTVSINVKTTSVPDGTNLYWSTLNVLGIVTAADFTDNSLTGSITINSGIATITRTLKSDILVDGTEAFAIQLRTDSVTGTIEETCEAIVVVKADQANPVQTETPLYSIMPVHNDIGNVIEGNTVTFNITTANIADGTTLYWTTDSVSGSINAADFTDGQLTGTVVVNKSTATITRTLTNDAITEGVESFIVRLRTGSISGTLVASSAVVNVSDYVAPAAQYIITPSDSNVNEGQYVNFKVSTVHVPNGTTLYWTTTYSVGSVIAADFSDGLTSGSVTIQNGTAVIPRILAQDAVTEGSESFALQLRTGSTSGTIVATSSFVTIKDTSPTLTPTYSATVSQTTVTEGSAIFINIQTTNVETGTELYWTTNSISGTIQATDFVDNDLDGSVLVSGGGATLVRYLRNDLQLEGDESFQIQIRTEVEGSNVATTPTITIKDLGAPTPSYMAMVDNTAVTEGGTVNFIVNTMNVPDGTLLHWTTHSTQGVVDASDFTDERTSGFVVVRNGSASITRTLAQDAVTEGTERFEIRLRTESVSGDVVATSPVITVYDFIPPTPEYSVVPSVGNVNEGNSVTFMVSASHVRNGTVLYWTSVLSAGTGASDFSDGLTSGTVTIYNGMGTITRTLIADVLTEGTESFSIQVRSGSTSGTVLATSSTVSINDTSATPPEVHSVKCNSTSVTEGNTVTFNVLTSNVANGTTLYWTTTGTVNSADFTDNQLSGSVVINGGMAIVQRTLTEDLITEGVENFQLQLRTGSTLGTIVATSPTVNVNDHVPPPSYSCSPSTSSVNEGDSVTFNITTANVANGTKLYYGVLSPSTSPADFVNASAGVLTVYNGSATVVLQTAADTMTEGSETFQLQLRTFGPNGETGPVVATSSSVTILDTSTAPAPAPYHAIHPDTTSLKVNEGSSVKFTVTEVNNVQSPKTLYWTTIGKADAQDFTDGRTEGAVVLVNGRGAITRGIRLDFDPERTEDFQLLLREDSTAGAIVATSPLVSIINVPLVKVFRINVQAATWARRTNVGTPITLTISVIHDASTEAGTYRVLPGSNSAGFLCLVDGQSSVNVNIGKGQTRTHVLSVNPRTAGYYTGTFIVEQTDGGGRVIVPWSVTASDPITHPRTPAYPPRPTPVHPPVHPPRPRPPAPHKPAPPRRHPRPIPLPIPHPRPPIPHPRPVPPRPPAVPPFPPRFCPDPNMLILLADGSQKRAGDLRIGDLVRTQHEHTLDWGDHKVSHVEIVTSEKTTLVFDHVEYICSTSHKFYVEGKGWTEVNQMEIGDSVIGVDGSHKLLEVKEASSGDVVVIQIDDAHTYISEGLLSHNKLILPPRFPTRPAPRPHPPRPAPRPPAPRPPSIPRRPPTFPRHPVFRRTPPSPPRSFPRFRR